MVGNIAEPLITLIAFGYGLGSLIKSIDGLPYIHFLASGSICMSVMMASSFEALYSAFSRMHVQKTWDSILNTPIEIDQIVFAEMLWAGSKSFISGIVILFVLLFLGIIKSWTVFLALPFLFLVGITFAALALVINAIAKSYDFFTFYFTLILTPMIFLSGIYFPVDKLPLWLQNVSHILPLNASVNLIRPLLMGEMPSNTLYCILNIMLFCILGFYFATILTRRRLLK